jgi:hypothetical protein
MSLVVAGITNCTVWMLSDTAITGPKIEQRERQYLPKIEPSDTSLVAFAGDEHNGSRLIRQVAAANERGRAIQILVDGSRGIGVEFGYAHFDANEPRLLRIADGNVQSVPTLFLGSKDAFETFQRIRHGDMSPYAPLALKTFMCGAREMVPEPLSSAIVAMTDVFVSRPERDGWAVSYFLSTDGPHFVSYCYSVSDPLFDRLAPGSLIPHGTQEEGGSNLSVTELGNGEGMVVCTKKIVLVQDNLNTHTKASLYEAFPQP